MTGAALKADDGEDPLAGLRAAVELKRAAERTEAEQVRRARVLGLTWAQIAHELGVSKQAVHRKYGGRGVLGIGAQK